MAGNIENGRAGAASGWRMARWTVVALLLLLPLVAMQFTDEVNWSAFDFAFAAVLLAGTVIPYELAVKKAGGIAYRAGAAVALGAAFLLVWLGAGVGIIGADGDPANLLYAGVIAVGIIGAIVARAEPRGLAFTLLAMALAQALIAAIAVIGKLGYPWSGPVELIGLNAFFVALFTASALLFRKAASGEQR